MDPDNCKDNVDICGGENSQTSSIITSNHAPSKDFNEFCHVTELEIAAVRDKELSSDAVTKEIPSDAKKDYAVSISAKNIVSVNQKSEEALNIVDDDSLVISAVDKLTVPVSDTQQGDISRRSSSPEVLSSADSSPIHRPDDLKLPWASNEKWWLKSSGLSRSLPTGYGSSTEALIDVAASTPLSSQGTVTKEGELISFYADGINDLIKLNSPRESGSPGTPMSSSTSGWSSSQASVSGYAYSKVSRSPSERTQSPDDVPPIDPFVLNDLEQQATKVAASVNKMFAALQKDLHKMSSLTCRSLEVYKETVDSTCDSIDGTIKGMYALMAKCEETSRNMQPIYQLHNQVKDINRLLDTLESLADKDSSQTPPAHS